MAIFFYYGPGFEEKTPPMEWLGMNIKATINDSSVEASLDTNELTFTGSAATYITQTFIPQYGVHNGCPLRVIVTENAVSKTVFDGMIVLTDLQRNSLIAPNILKCNVRDGNNNINIFDKMAVLTQGVLKKQGYLTQSCYGNSPIVKVSKKNIQDRQIAMLNIAYEIVSSFVGWIQDFLSAISDIVGLSAAIGLVELATLFINIIIQLNQIIDLLWSHKDLLLASQTYYKALHLKSAVEAAFSKYNTTVEWGVIEGELDGIYIQASNNGFVGLPFPTNIITGELKAGDYGYVIGELLEFIKKRFNTREDIINGVAHIKWKLDPFWTTSPAFTPENALVEQTAQYQNGYYSNATEEIYQTTIIDYEIDAADAWTLTQNGEAHEVHLELINELDPKYNLLKGINDIKFPYALGYRYEPTQTIIQLLQDSFGLFGNFLGQFQGVLDQFAGYIDISQGGGSELSQILNMAGLNFVFALQPGGLQVEDDTWGVPKVFYAKNVNGVLNIPANHKDIMGARAIYNNWYFPDSPSAENNFKGQYTWIRDWNIPFSLSNYVNTIQNPNFLLNTANAKFTFINWTVDKRSAVTDVKVNQPFDKNIKETEI